MTTETFPETTFSLSDDGRLASIKLGGETITADSATLENFIGHLGLLRSRMQPEVPAQLDAEARYLQVDGAAMTIADSDDLKSVGFLFRTPTYGWIACGIPVAQAVAMGRHLVDTFGARAAASNN